MTKPLTITSMVTQESISFKAYLTDISQTFSSTWNTTDVYGRNDPIATFQGTKRTISIAFDVPAANAWEASNNLEKCSKLATFLYPGYNVDGVVRKKKFVEVSKTISRAPLVKIKWANLIDSMAGKKAQKEKTNADVLGLTPFIEAATVIPEPPPPPEEKKKEKVIPGLLGFIDSYSFNPVMEAGMFMGGGEYYPRTINVSFSFTVLHQTDLGHSSQEITIKNGKIKYGELGWIAGKLPFT